MNKKVEVELILQRTLAPISKAFEWVRFVMSLNSAILGLIVALKSIPSRNPEEHLLFITAIALLIAGLLLGCFVLFFEALMHSYINGLSTLLTNDAVDSKRLPRMKRQFRWTGSALVICGVLYWACFGFGLLYLFKYAGAAFAPIQ